MPRSASESRPMTWSACRLSAPSTPPIDCKTCSGINGQTSSELQAGGTRILKLVREQFQQARTSLLDYLKKSQTAAR